MQGSIILEGTVYLIPSLCAMSKLIFCDSCHMVDVAWTKILIIYELVAHPSVTIFLGWIQERSCI